MLRLSLKAGASENGSDAVEDSGDVMARDTGNPAPFSGALKSLEVHVRTRTGQSLFRLGLCHEPGKRAWHADWMVPAIA